MTVYKAAKQEAGALADAGDRAGQGREGRDHRHGQGRRRATATSRRSCSTRSRSPRTTSSDVIDDGASDGSRRVHRRLRRSCAPTAGIRARSTERGAVHHVGRPRPWPPVARRHRPDGCQSAPIRRTPQHDRHPLLELRGVNKSFGAVHVLHDVDFDVYPGQVTALVGDNGAGKSTLVKCIAGIYAVDSGEYLFEGKPVTVHGPATPPPSASRSSTRTSRCATTSTSSRTCSSAASSQARRRCSTRPPMEQQARETLAVLSVRTVKSVRQQRRQPLRWPAPDRGHRQGGAVEHQGRLLDEPTAALGVAQTRQVLDLVRRLADQGLGVVLISHNMNDVFEVADRIAALYLGRVAAEVADQGRHHTPDRRADHRRPLRRHRHRRRAVDESSGGRRHDRRTPTTTPESAAPRRRASPSTSPAATLGDAVRAYVNRLRGGDMGALPAVLGLVVLFVVFSLAAADTLPDHATTSPTCSPRPAPIMRHRDGPGLRAAARRDRPVRRRRRRRLRGRHRPSTLTQHDWPWYVAVLAACVTGAVIGLVIGSLVAKLGIPSFVVTLAFFLAFQGVTLKLIGEGGTLPIRDRVIAA